MESIVARLKGYLEFKSISTSIAEKRIGVSNGTLSKPFNANTTIKTDTLEKFLKVYTDVNPEWVLLETGSMIKDVELNYMEGSTDKYDVLKPIPLVSVSAVGGFGNHSFAISDRDVKEYYTIPKFRHKKVDFMIEVEGSSMYPKYNSGDVVACTIINENSFIQWNKTHVIATKEQGIIIKRIKKASDNERLCMMSDNKDYDAFEVPKEEIIGMALVVGVIRLE